MPIRPGQPIRIAPSILNADFTRLGEQIALVEEAGVDLLHLDIMDGHFVPNISIGVPVVRSVSRCTRLMLDAHLMISDPGRYAPEFVKAGAGLITFHIEAVQQARQIVKQIRDLGVQVGVSLNPGTPAEAISEVVGEVDLVLVMTVWPGFGGQSFMPECLPKIETISDWLGPGQSLQVDGGITPETAPLVVAAGADTLVAGSVVFRSDNPPAVIAALRRVASETIGQGNTGTRL